MTQNRSHEYIDPLLRSMRSMTHKQFPFKTALGKTSKAFYKEFLVSEEQNIKEYRRFVKDHGYRGEYDGGIDYLSIKKIPVDFIKSRFTHVLNNQKNK